MLQPHLEMTVPANDQTYPVKITTEWPHGLHPQSVAGIKLKIPDPVDRIGDIIAKRSAYALCPVQGPVPLV
jgi:hypothetical protein